MKTFQDIINETKDLSSSYISIKYDVKDSSDGRRWSHRDISYNNAGIPIIKMYTYEKKILVRRFYLNGIEFERQDYIPDDDMSVDIKNNEDNIASFSPYYSTIESSKNVGSCLVTSNILDNNMYDYQGIPVRDAGFILVVDEDPHIIGLKWNASINNDKLYIRLDKSDDNDEFHIGHYIDVVHSNGDYRLLSNDIIEKIIPYISLNHPCISINHIDQTFMVNQYNNVCDLTILSSIEIKNEDGEIINQPIESIFSTDDVTVENFIIPEPLKIVTTWFDDGNLEKNDQVGSFDSDGLCNNLLNVNKREINYTDSSNDYMFTKIFYDYSDTSNFIENNIPDIQFCESLYINDILIVKHLDILNWYTPSIINDNDVNDNVTDDIIYNNLNHVGIKSTHVDLIINKTVQQAVNNIYEVNTNANVSYAIIPKDVNKEVKINIKLKENLNIGYKFEYGPEFKKEIIYTCKTEKENKVDIQPNPDNLTLKELKVHFFNNIEDIEEEDINGLIKLSIGDVITTKYEWLIPNIKMNVNEVLSKNSDSDIGSLLGLVKVSNMRTKNDNFSENITFKFSDDSILTFMHNDDLERNELKAVKAGIVEIEVSLTEHDYYYEKPKTLTVVVEDDNIKDEIISIDWSIENVVINEGESTIVALIATYASGLQRNVTRDYKLSYNDNIIAISDNLVQARKVGNASIVAKLKEVEYLTYLKDIPTEITNISKVLPVSVLNKSLYIDDNKSKVVVKDCNFSIYGKYLDNNGNLIVKNITDNYIENNMLNTNLILYDDKNIKLSVITNDEYGKIINITPLKTTPLKTDYENKLTIIHPFEIDNKPINNSVYIYRNKLVISKIDITDENKNIITDKNSYVYSNDSKDLNALLIPNDSSFNKLSWDSSETDIIEIDENGTFTATGKNIGDSIIELHAETENAITNSYESYTTTRMNYNIDFNFDTSDKAIITNITFTPFVLDVVKNGKSVKDGHDTRIDLYGKKINSIIDPNNIILDNNKVYRFAFYTSNNLHLCDVSFTYLYDSNSVDTAQLSSILKYQTEKYWNHNAERTYLLLLKHLNKGETIYVQCCGNKIDNSNTNPGDKHYDYYPSNDSYYRGYGFAFGCDNDVFYSDTTTITEYLIESGKITLQCKINPKESYNHEKCIYMFEFNLNDTINISYSSIYKFLLKSSNKNASDELLDANVILHSESDSAKVSTLYESDHSSNVKNIYNWLKDYGEKKMTTGVKYFSYCQYNVVNAYWREFSQDYLLSFIIIKKDYIDNNDINRHFCNEELLEYLSYKNAHITFTLYKLTANTNYNDNDNFNKIESSEIIRTSNGDKLENILIDRIYESDSGYNEILPDEVTDGVCLNITTKDERLKSYEFDRYEQPGKFGISISITLLDIDNYHSYDNNTREKNNKSLDAIIKDAGLKLYWSEPALLPLLPVSSNSNTKAIDMIKKLDITQNKETIGILNILLENSYDFYDIISFNDNECYLCNFYVYDENYEKPKYTYSDNNLNSVYKVPLYKIPGKKILATCPGTVDENNTDKINYSIASDTRDWSNLFEAISVKMNTGNTVYKEFPYLLDITKYFLKSEFTELNDLSSTSRYFSKYSARTFIDVAGVKVSSIKFKDKNITLQVEDDENYKVEYTILPENAFNKNTKLIFTSNVRHKFLDVNSYSKKLHAFDEGSGILKIISLDNPEIYDEIEIKAIDNRVQKVIIDDGNDNEYEHYDNGYYNNDINVKVMSPESQKWWYKLYDHGILEKTGIIRNVVNDITELPYNLPKVEKYDNDDFPRYYLPVNNSIQLKASVIPANAYDGDLVWYSSEPGLVRITQDGIATALRNKDLDIYGEDIYSEETKIVSEEGNTKIYPLQTRRFPNTCWITAVNKKTMKSAVCQVRVTKNIITNISISDITSHNYDLDDANNKKDEYNRFESPEMYMNYIIEYGDIVEIPITISAQDSNFGPSNNIKWIYDYDLTSKYKVDNITKAIDIQQLNKSCIIDHMNSSLTYDWTGKSPVTINNNKKNIILELTGQRLGDVVIHAESDAPYYVSEDYRLNTTQTSTTGHAYVSIDKKDFVIHNLSGLLYKNNDDTNMGSWYCVPNANVTVFKSPIKDINTLNDYEIIIQVPQFTQSGSDLFFDNDKTFISVKILDSKDNTVTAKPMSNVKVSFEVYKNINETIKSADITDKNGIAYYPPRNNTHNNVTVKYTDITSYPDPNVSTDPMPPAKSKELKIRVVATPDDIRLTIFNNLLIKNIDDLHGFGAYWNQYTMLQLEQLNPNDNSIETGQPVFIEFTDEFNDILNDSKDMTSNVQLDSKYLSFAWFSSNHRVLEISEMTENDLENLGAINVSENYAQTTNPFIGYGRYMKLIPKEKGEATLTIVNVMSGKSWTRLVEVVDRN